MTSFITTFFLTTVTMSMIILLIWFIYRVFPKLFSAQSRYGVWVIILFGLIIPIRPLIGGGFIQIPFFSPAPADAEMADSAALLPVTSVVYLETLPSEEAIPVPHAVAPALASFSLADVLLMGWAIGAVSVFAYHMVQYVRFQRAIKRWGEDEEDQVVRDLFFDIQREMGLSHKKIGLMTCSFVTSSMLTGFLRPVVLLPEKNFDHDELAFIFRHELIHYKRHDLLVKFLSLIAVSLHWFNPLVYLMSRAMQTEGEASCDEAVLQDTDMESRHFYAEVVIGMIGKRKRMTFLATNFYGGKSGIQKRLESMMDMSNKRPVLSYAILAFVVVLVAFSGSVFAYPGQEVTSTLSESEFVTEYLVSQEAEAIALAMVGGGAVVQTEYSFEHGEGLLFLIRVYYRGVYYQVEINASNGEILGLYTILDSFDEIDEGVVNDELSDLTRADVSEETSSAFALQEPTGHAQITREHAAEIALGLVPGGTVIDVDDDWENGRVVWYVAIRSGGSVHEVYVDVQTGEIVDHEWYED